MKTTRLIVFCMTSLFVIGASNFSGEQDKSLPYFENAKKSLYEKDWKSAEVSLVKIINEFPQSNYLADSLYWLGFCFNKLSETAQTTEEKIRQKQDAITHLNSLIERFSRNPWVHDAEVLRNEIALKLVQNGRPEYKKYIGGEIGIEKDKTSLFIQDETGWIREFSYTSIKHALILKLKAHTDNVTEAQGMDLTGENFAQTSLQELWQLSYDTKTLWPEENRLPPGFRPGVVLTSAISPGLGIRKLHEYGITGKGISVAVIDKPILSTHREFSGRIEYIEVFKDHPRNKRLHFHGIACASLLAGEKCGVANQGFLYYFAVPDDGKNVSNYTAALEIILQINSELPGPKKIKVVSISDGIPSDKKDHPDSIKLLQTFKEAEKQGIAVVHCGVFPINFIVTGCPPGKNREEAENYELWLYWQRRIYETDVKERKTYLDNLKLRIGNYICVPGEYRTTASNSGNGEYTYWGGEGGLSWACPYLAGLIALGLQVNTSISAQDLYKVIIETSTFNRFGIKVVNPDAYIKKVKNNV